jgi:hypothetical protein
MGVPLLDAEMTHGRCAARPSGSVCFGRDPQGKGAAMGLFSRAPTSHAGPGDTRDRDYILTGCPLVTADDLVVLVDLTVRLTVRPDEQWGHDPADERAIHAVVVLVLRLVAEELPAEELLVGRARIVEAVGKALSFSPVPVGVGGRVTAVDVRRYDSSAAMLQHEFRVVGS